MGTFVHPCEGQMVCASINPKIPYFNAPIFLENKATIGKVEEVLGPINQVYFTIKPQEGIQATSFRSGDKFFISSDKLLPLDKFLPKPKPPPGKLELNSQASRVPGKARVLTKRRREETQETQRCWRSTRPWRPRRKGRTRRASGSWR